MSLFKTSHRSLYTTSLTAIVFALASATATADCATTCLQAEQQVLSALSQIISTGCAQAVSTGNQEVYAACVNGITLQINTAATNVRNEVILQCNITCRDPKDPEVPV
jgi:hypothetical protein